MEPVSLALRTDLIMDRFFGQIIDRGDYLVVQTPSRPTYYWGNYLIMNGPPRAGDFERWTQLFEKEMGPRAERGFMALTWDGIDGEQGATKPFVDDGFTIERTTVLTTQSVNPPPKYHADLVVRPNTSDEDWDRFVDIHFDPEWIYGDEASQREFLADGRDRFRAMTQTGVAMRFGVEWQGQLVGDAGIFWQDKIGRFDNVATHPNHRRKGICSTLIYHMSRYALDTLKLDYLVMEADENYHAANVYESVGFVPTERTVKLQWCVTT